MKLINEDKNKIKEHLKSILNQNWKKSKKMDRLKIVSKAYCIEFPNCTWDISGLYTQAKKEL